jgi:hypothetical protein
MALAVDIAATVVIAGLAVTADMEATQTKAVQASSHHNLRRPQHLHL